MRDLAIDPRLLITPANSRIVPHSYRARTPLWRDAPIAQWKSVPSYTHHTELTLACWYSAKAAAARSLEKARIDLFPS